MSCCSTQASSGLTHNRLNCKGLARTNAVVYFARRVSNEEEKYLNIFMTMLHTFFLTDYDMYVHPSLMFVCEWRGKHLSLGYSLALLTILSDPNSLAYPKAKLLTRYRHK